MQSMWWFIGALLLGIAEIFTLDLMLVMLAGGAVAAGGASLLGAPPWLAIVVFCVASALLLFALRPYLLKYMRLRGPVQETNVSSLVGKPAFAIDDVTAKSGRVKLVGEVWTARVAPGSSPVSEGSEVTVVAIQGATAIVAAETE